MKARPIASIVAICLFCGWIQMLSALVGAAAAILAGVAVGAITLSLLHFLEIEIPQFWLLLLLPGISSFLGIGLLAIGSNLAGEVWLAPASAIATTGIILLLRNLNSRRCSLCNRRLGKNAVKFDCPRCGLLVCDQTCWDFERRRCRLCDQNRVPIFPAEGRWWDRHFGPSSCYGRCQICLATPDKTDLRNCVRCGRPHCRDCWDYLNGQCSRCDWIVPDLPEALHVYMLAIDGTPSKRN